MLSTAFVATDGEFSINIFLKGYHYYSLNCVTANWPPSLHREKRVSVVFRGTVTSHNWLMNFKWQMSEHSNPIPDDYPGRCDTVGLHTGFALYLTRQRKDDSLTKIEEIFSNISSIGRELAPDGDFELRCVIDCYTL